jgi:hypothetical protein
VPPLPRQLLLLCQSVCTERSRSLLRLLHLLHHKRHLPRLLLLQPRSLLFLRLDLLLQLRSLLFLRLDLLLQLQSLLPLLAPTESHYKREVCAR